MQNIDIEQSIRAICALCAEITKLKIRGEYYFYFRANRSEDLEVLKYIFRKNGISAELHKTHYYDIANRKRLVLRMPVENLDANVDFKRRFEYVYSNRDSLPNVDLTNSAEQKPAFFALRPMAVKMKYISAIADKTK